MARLHSACTVAKSTTLTNLPKRIDGQWMNHTISRLDAKHVEDAKVVLEYREAHLQSESQTDNQIEESW